jgi:hypothetical protein
MIFSIHTSFLFFYLILRRNRNKYTKINIPSKLFFFRKEKIYFFPLISYDGTFLSPLIPLTRQPPCPSTHPCPSGGGEGRGGKGD